MRGRLGIARFGIASVVCGVMSFALWYGLVYTRLFRNSWIYPGWVFLLHVALAVVGLVLGIVGLRRELIFSILGLLICGYFVLIQLILR
jgi:hypothetical protein